ncbi:MAG TPA: DUF2520 domain-containing protein [Alphaproteobacteria bacterium]|nr:DUF2520 domain-containing protein [Alphaproteobacteria bacterium]
MKATKSITLIGAGSLASALGPALKRAGYRIDAVVARNRPRSERRVALLARKLGARAIPLDEVQPTSEIVWLCTPDDALATTAKLLAQRRNWRKRIVFHSSGALTSDVLSPLRRKGAHIASLHPMMTFVANSPPKMAGVPFAVEGDPRAVAAARQIVKALNANIFSIRKKSKVLYHALGSFSSPMIVATLVTAERVGRAAGLTRSQTRKVMAPILQQTIKNYLLHGPAAAFSGPIKRGDLETVRRHLRELKRVPEAKSAYQALVRSALRDLPSAKRNELLRLLR